MQNELKDGVPEGWVFLSLHQGRMAMSAIQDVWLVVAQTMTRAGDADIFLASRRKTRYALSLGPNVV